MKKQKERSHGLKNALKEQRTKIQEEHRKKLKKRQDKKERKKK